MKVLFLGSSHFSKVVLEKMIEKGNMISCVITQPDKPSGRGHKMTQTEVKRYAIEKGLPVLTFDKIRLHIDEIKKIDFDISVVASFGQILPDEFLGLKLCINVHPSLLPKYRGASPIQTAILNGDNVTGVTIMKVAKEVDAGDIIIQKEFSLSGEYFHEAEEKLAILGGEMVSDVVKDYEKGKITFTKQDGERATFTQKFSKEDGLLDFSMSAQDIVNKVRAISQEVGTYFGICGTAIKVEKVADVSGEFETEQGMILNNKKRFIIGAQNGAVEILVCKAPSGKSVSGRDFLNGHNEFLSKSVDKASIRYDNA